ncbi:MAG: dehydrogenase, partial [Verrucomicrobia bacterium]|nr:dehydrogenase [Verrucomicrobiota bacterium]
MSPFPALLALLAATTFSAAQTAPKDYSLLKTREDKADASKWPDLSKGSPTPHAPALNPPAATVARPQSVAAPATGERVVFIGNGFAERDTYYGRLETELHLRFPTQELFVRNMGRSGDTPAFRPHPARASQWAFPGAEKFHPEYAQHNGKGFFSTPDQWLFHLKADTIVAFFGYNESFDGPGRVANYEAELDAFVVHSLSKAYNGKTAPRLVLVSPIAFEDLSKQRDLPNGQAENANLELYAAAMERVAKKHGLTYIDLFHPTLAAYAQAKTPYTINGFAPTDRGYREMAKLLADGLYGPTARASQADEALVNAAVKSKDYLWNCDYSIINGVHTHGQRYNPFGPQNYPAEVAKAREMAALRDDLIHGIAQGKRKDLAVDDSKTLPLPPVPSNFKPDMKNGNPTEFLSGEAAIAKMQVAPGYKVELFASEEKFPDLKKPVQMSFDGKGRLWVATTPTYPHYRPGDALPNDKLIILEDTDGDGKADKQTVFADHLHLPIGFELTPEGVYVSQEPNLALLIDDDKDGKADRMELILHGFDSHDSHHAISAYCADASGAFYLLEGRFLHSQVETPYGPRRCNDGGAWRFDPKSFRLERLQVDISNPWGFSFDTWEQPFISDASPGENWWALPLSSKMPYGIEQVKVEQFVPKRSRPSSGAEFVSSRHFPDVNQGDFMTCNTIGFLGISFGTKRDDGAGFVGKANGDLLSSSDGNFRPVDLEFAPDGSLYFLDWHNPLIGHMQHNARDPNRDHERGRIYRITYPERPLVKPAKVAGASVAELLENLKEPEYRTRYRTRRELRAHKAAEVLPAVKAWAAQLDPKDPAYEHHLCEALWATWAQNKPDADLIAQLLKAKQPEARAAAVDVIRHSFWQLPNHVELLNQAVRDENARVRLTAIVAATWLDNADGAKIALEAFRKPIDRWVGPVLHYALTYTLKDDVEALKAAGQLNLEGNQAAADYFSGKLKIGEPVPEAGTNSKPARKLTAEEEKIFKLGREIYFRDAHCATCHQADGKGIPNIYPPLAKSNWLDDDQRVTKILLKGLWGQITVNGQHFDPTKGVPPMMGFGGMLNDDEAAAVLSYVRLSFGNNGKFVSPATVKKVREATKDRVNFYMTDEILKEHPL